MRYKILFISSWFPNKLEPTNGNFVQRHAEAVSLLHDVEILHAIGDSKQNQTYLFDDQIINGIRTLLVYYQNSKNPLLNFSRRIKAYKKGFSKMQTPDLVHGNILYKSMLFAVYLKKKFKIPFVISEHWSGFLEINKKNLSVAELFFAKLIARNAEFILPVSCYLENDLKKIVVSQKMKVIGNVVDTKIFHLKKKQNKEFTFLHISNLIPLKNPDKIVAAAIRLRKEFSNFHLQIGGDGDVNSLKKRIYQNDAQTFISTFPMLTLKGVAMKMQQSDCFILFSNYENFPCVLLESLSTGTPVITTKVGGIPEVINATNGLLISNSEAELYEAMKNVLLGKENFDIPEKLHQYIDQHFSMEKIAYKFDEIYQQVLHKKKSSI